MCLRYSKATVNWMVAVTKGEHVVGEKKLAGSRRNIVESTYCLLLHADSRLKRTLDSAYQDSSSGRPQCA